MAIFHFNISSVKRSNGQQATAAAAYRAGEAIRDERRGELHDYSHRQDVRHKEILLPSQFEGLPMEWARDRTRLWNTAESAEKRRNSRVAREFQVALPPELSPEQRLALARSFAREVSNRYGVAVDLAVHDPKPDRPSNNYHAHLLTTTREVTLTGLGAKTGLDMQAVIRAQRGLTSHVEEYSALRERWAVATNHALHEASLDVRVDHRSLAAQGIERAPMVHVPMEFYSLERQGMSKEAAEQLREQYRTRVAAHRERTRQVAPVTQALEPRPGAVSAPESPVVTPRNVEEVRRRAVRQWLAMRSKEAESSRPQRDATRQADLARSAEAGTDPDNGRGR